MPSLVSISYDKLVKKLKRAGYIPIRKSKHTIYFHREKQITIPVPHKHSVGISKGLLNKLIKEMKLSRDEFNNL